MTGGTPNHGFVVANIVAELRNRLRGKRCRMLPAEGNGVATIGTNVRYPDATMTCSPIQRKARLTPEPVVVFEVVSESSIRLDRVIKMREYHAVPSIKRYVIVEQDSPVLVCYSRRNDGPWTATSLSLGDTLELPEIDIEIPVGDMFEGVSWGDDQGD